jgi:ABC-type uncharacterized transport system substrate-binding protein
MKKATASSILVTAMLLAVAVMADAQQPTKVPRIGWLTASSLPAMTQRIDAFRQGLRELGYVEGRNIAIEWRAADGKRDRVPALVTELVGLKVTVIVSAGPLVTRAAKEATVTIPIVMAMDDDPVGNGFVPSLARPSVTLLASPGLPPS